MNSSVPARWITWPTPPSTATSTGGTSARASVTSLLLYELSSTSEAPERDHGVRPRLSRCRSSASFRSTSRSRAACRRRPSATSCGRRGDRRHPRVEGDRRGHPFRRRRRELLGDRGRRPQSGAARHRDDAATTSTRPVHRPRCPGQPRPGHRRTWGRRRPRPAASRSPPPRTGRPRRSGGRRADDDDPESVRRRAAAGAPGTASTTGASGTTRSIGFPRRDSPGATGAAVHAAGNGAGSPIGRSCAQGESAPPSPQRFLVVSHTTLDHTPTTPEQRDPHRAMSERPTPRAVRSSQRPHSNRR